MGGLGDRAVGFLPGRGVFFDRWAIRRQTLVYVHQISLVNYVTSESLSWRDHIYFLYRRWTLQTSVLALYH